MMRFLRSLTQYQRTIFRLIAVTAILILGVIIIINTRKPPRIIQLDPITKVVEVPVEKLTTKTVTQYVPVPDRTQVTQLLKENEKLHTDVQQLTVSLAEATRTGTGTVTISTPPQTPPTPKDRVPVSVHFQDWRLAFDSNGTTATYTLHQQFSVVTTVGRDKNNTPINLVRLFEVGERGQRLPIPLVETTTVATMPNQPHWYVKARFQGGVGLFPSATPASSRVNYSGVVSMPWLQRGTIKAVEYTRYAYLAPAVAGNNTEQAIGLLPISFNLGTVKHLPITDVWVSPFVGVRTSDNMKKFAVVFTTTF